MIGYIKIYTTKFILKNCILKSTVLLVYTDKQITKVVS
jgi:hypothetical protein